MANDLEESNGENTNGDANQKIYDRFNDQVQYMIIYAKAASINANVDCIYPESFVIGLLTMGINDVSKTLVRHNIDLDKCLKDFKEQLGERKSKKANVTSNTHYDSIKPTKVVKDICQLACRIGDELSHDMISVQHIFLSIIETCPDIKKKFVDAGLDVEEFKSDLRNLKPGTVQTTTKKKSQSGNSGNVTALEAFCIDMTAAASNNEFDPIMARDNEIEEAITVLCRRNKSNPILVGDAGVGKCLAKGTKIIMYDGSFKSVEDINVGDLLMGVDSTPRKVLSLGHGFDEMFKIKQIHGEDYVVNSNHILSLRRSGGDEILNISIQEYMQQHNSFKHKWKGWKTPINFSRKELPIDPYFLGLWLGDGTARKAQITNTDKEIVNYCGDFGMEHNHKITNYGISINFVNNDHDEILQMDKDSGKIIKKFPTMRSVHLHMNKQESGYITSVLNTDLHAYGYSWERNKEKQNSIYSDLKKINVIKNKHIPDLFKFNDEKSRLSLLAVIIDSDGHLANNCYDIVQKNKRLALDIVFVARSLGFYVSLKEKIATMKRKDGSVYRCLVYRMFISGDTDRIPCLIKRKIASKRKQIKNVLNTGIEVESIGKGEYYGFTIGGDHLFVLGDFTVTHNTAIVEGICQRIISQTVPKKLQNSKVYALNMGGLVAGTKYRGEFENRMQAIIKELKDNPSYILFVDEIHTMIGAGSASGSIDASNMLKPALARGLKCIGATTNAEYKKIFSGDGALDRRFERIVVDEPSSEDTLRIIRGIKFKLEEYHKCTITEDAIEMAVKLSKRYKPEKHFPDKAIDCLDTACAKYAWKDSEVSQIVGHDVAMVISKQCKIPLEIILWDNYERVINTENILRKNIIGQDHVVQAICRVLRNSYSGVRNPDKPIGIFVMGGESGTGKTHTARELAKALFDNDASFIRIDMSEYSESHSVSKITGSPPGYVGFNEVDVVADKIRNRPYCVLLLDEIEKAHPNAIKLFLQVMSEGFFTDSTGDKVNCKNIIMIMTGNFGMNENRKSQLGFGADAGKSEYELEKNRLISFCKGEYGVEFINRVDDFIPFRKLNDTDLEVIARLEIIKLTKRIDRKDCNIVFGDKVAKRMVELSKNEHGINAMIIDRLVSKYLEPCLADEFLKLENGKDILYTILVDVDDEGKFVAKKKQKKTK